MRKLKKYFVENIENIMNTELTLQNNYSSIFLDSSCPMHNVNLGATACHVNFYVSSCLHTKFVQKTSARLFIQPIATCFFVFWIKGRICGMEYGLKRKGKISFHETFYKAM